MEAKLNKVWNQGGFPPFFLRWGKRETHGLPSGDLIPFEIEKRPFCTIT